MFIRTLMYTSALFTSTALHSMETVTNNKNTYKQYYDDCPINKELLFAHTMRKNNILPHDVANYLIQYCLLLRNNDFYNNTEPFIVQWKDFCIPPYYYHTLRPQHIVLIKELLSKQPFSTRFGCGQCELHYPLQSHKDYKLFLDLPIELRRCLTKLPESEIKKINPLRSCYLPPDFQIDITINETKTILVRSRSKTKADRLISPKQPTQGHASNYFGYKKKLIIPEEAPKKKTNKTSHKNSSLIQ